jgi:hypothetical protein
VGVDKHQGIYRESLTGSVARRFVFIKQLILVWELKNEFDGRTGIC